MSSYITNHSTNNYYNNCKHTTTSLARERLVRKHQESDQESEKLPNKWKEQHEELLNQIRAAKKFQGFINRGGNVRDLPQPPPSENPDYIQCPHCLRRFNKEAASRHIPKCSTYTHNKPKSVKVRHNLGKRVTQ